MTVLKISAKNLNPNVSYHNFKDQSFNESFLEKAKVKEVKKGSLFLPILLASNTILIPNIAFAETPSIMNTEEITKLGIQVATFSVGVSVGVSAILLSVAGIYRMLRKKKEATEWTTDIIKGLVQSLVAIPTVYLLYYVATSLFKNIGDITKTL